MTGKTLLWAGHLALGLLLAWELFFLFGGAGKGQSARDLGDGRVEFAPRRFASGVWLVVIVYLFWACASSMMRMTHSRWKISAFLFVAAWGLMAVSLLFSWPGTIVVTGHGLRQTYWFGRNKLIRWEDIVEINTGKKARTVTITGADGSRIIHSAQLGDRRRFLRELREHCGENLPSDFPREPLGDV